MRVLYQRVRTVDIRTNSAVDAEFLLLSQCCHQSFLDNDLCKAPNLRVRIAELMSIETGIQD